jgi:hypothetical protein
MGPKWPHDHRYSAGKSRPIRNSDALEPTRQHQVTLFRGSLGDWRLIVYGALFWLAFHLFVVAYEEPTLEQTFGGEYEAFRANVPRWIPRMTPWRPSRMKE